MSTSHLLFEPAGGVHYPLNSRPSSTTLFLSQRIPHSYIDGATDPVDISIAQGLLQKESPQIPKRRSSFTYSTTTQQPRFPLDNDKQLGQSVPFYRRHLRQGIGSNTWTSSSGEGSEEDRNDDRTSFVNEYNKLAKKYGVQTIVLDEFVAVHADKSIISTKLGHWVLRKLLRRTFSFQVSRHKAEKHIRHKRSVSDISLRIRPKKDTLQGKDLVELVRLCGASPLYLPAEYAAGTLVVPTCFRATAQYLVQHAATSRGIFRIPGAHTTINALYNHYASQDEGGEVINGTVRYPTLPEHIQCNVHDVASAFKRFLAGLPGGILGKAWLFNTLMSIYSQLDAEAELMRTKQSKVQARLIALAIATIASRYQRELICAVLGLLSMIGRAAETAPKEDKHGRPLPTSDLMGYEALGIVFGPLLIGNLLESYELCPTGLHSSLICIQRSPQITSKGKRKENKIAEDSVTLLQGTDKIRIINSITEMLITHWRDVVRHMKNLGALKTITQHHGLTRANAGGLAPPLLPEPFTIRRPRDWDTAKLSIRHVDRSISPTPSSRNDQINNLRSLHGGTSTTQDDMLPVRKRRPRPMSSQNLSRAKSMIILAPTAEETPMEEKHEQPMPDADLEVSQTAVLLPERGGVKALQSTQAFHTARSEQVGKSNLEQAMSEKTEAVSHLAKQDLSSTKLNKKDFEKTPGEGHTKSKIDDEVLKKRFLGGENTKMDVYKPVTKQTCVSPFRDIQKPSEGFSKQLVMTSAPLGSSNYVWNQPEAISQVLIGIVSSRLRGIATSDPGLGPPSVFAGILKTDHKGRFPQKRRPNTTTGTPRNFEYFPKDPLTRVSQEEDIASLASLAGVIQSQDQTVTINSFSNLDLITLPDTPVNVVKSHTRSTISVTSIAERHNIDSLSNTNKQEDLQGDLAFATKTASPADTGTLPMTPRRSATELSILHRSGGSSVRVLAARFGNAATSVRQVPSPANTPDSRVWHRSLVEKAVVAPYTVNTSPVPMVQKLIRSDTSPQRIRNSVQVKMRPVVSSSRLQSTASPLLPKPLFSSSYHQEDSGPPHWPKLRPVNRSPRLDSDMLQVGRNSVALPPFSSTLHRTGDGYVSLALSRKPSLGTILPRPGEPPVAGYIDLPRAAAMYADHHPFPFDFSTSSSILKNGLSSSSIGNQRTKNQSTSILHTQIQNLSKQLRAKTDDVNHLKQHLGTRDSINDLETLNQQLRQAKRELTVWRGRAEVAEKRLRVLSQFSQKILGDAVVNEQPATDLSETGGSNFIEEEARSKSRIRNELHGLGGICTDHSLLGSDGTIRRTSPKQWYGSETILYNAEGRLLQNTEHTGLRETI